MSNVSGLIKMRAYTDRNGIIFFGRTIPEGMLPILFVCYADEDEREFQLKVSGMVGTKEQTVSFNGKDGELLYKVVTVIEGIWDAKEDDNAALRALRAFNNQFRI
jgi:hypothetical protein